ncbi:hypothetical protein QBC34DRAFT_20178 [Podospora aff. communis PSN243]|uniref:HhH-GPD domain-containing protein n=1 Tax=Podospora aff. communis PSN243 TaxID=3040156 RepID=A0AAV9GWX3_9PEZI|nr:hypothetical protein QBC34DRAFT_20178 [Podospora aff. communis PSN243]
MQTRAAALKLPKQHDGKAQTSLAITPGSTTGEGLNQSVQSSVALNGTPDTAATTTPVRRKASEAAERLPASPKPASIPKTTASAGEPDEEQRADTTPKIAATASKRKRGKAVPRQPMKGGWVLPHGMGVSLGPVDGPVPSVGQAAHSTPSRHQPLPDVALPATSQKSPKKAAGKQTKLAFKVTKPSAATTKENGQSMAAARVEENAPNKDEEVENSQPSSNTRRPKLVTTHKADKRVAEIVEAEVEEEVLTVLGGASVPESTVVIKEENPTVVADATAETSTHKLLIIKGVSIADGIPTKHGEKIIVDATQILDPDFRMTLKRGLENKYGLTPGYSPYPYRRVPTPEDCEEVYRLLADMHGECMPPKDMPAASLTVAGCGEVPCVLDALLRTLISGYTKMEHADQAIQNLVQHYGLRTTGTGKGSIDWEKVRQSPHSELKKVIEIAGGGNQRARYIKSTLDMVYEENLAKHDAASSKDEDLLSLDYMHSMTKDEALAKFVSYPGIGIKTAACVTLFCLQIPCFAVDTHVHRFCRWLGWSAPKADPDNCFRHADHMVPDHLKYGLHQLFIRHGKLCFKCRAITKPGTKDWNEAPDCPLEHLLTRTKDEATSTKRKRDTEEGESDADDEEDGESKPKSKKPRAQKTKAADISIQEDSETDSGEDDDDKLQVQAGAKRPRLTAAKAAKSPVQNDSDTEMEDGVDQSQVEVKAAAKKPTVVRPKAALPLSKMSQSNTDGTKKKPRTPRVIQSEATNTAAEEHYKSDEDAAEDEAHQSDMGLDVAATASEIPINIQDSTQSTSTSPQIESELLAGAALDSTVAKDKGSSQHTTTSSSALSEVSDMSELSDLSDLSDMEGDK